MSRYLFPPKNATDCHTHLVGNQSKYPMVSPRSYTPATVSSEDARQMMKSVGVERIVLIQISVHGTDNTCMIDGLNALGDRARGVAQVDASTSNGDLDRMHDAGVRGVRVNLDTLGVSDPADARRMLRLAADKCERNGWHVQLFASPPIISALGRGLREFRVPLVIDHFGLLPVLDRGETAETIVRDLLSEGKAWVKISAPYRLDHPDAQDEIAALAQDLFRENPDSVVWGSDWPHPPQHNSRPVSDPKPKPYRDIDPAAMLKCVETWFDDPQDRMRILVSNPARLYAFP